MPLDPDILNLLKQKSPHVDLRNKKLNDADIALLVKELEKKPQIVSLDLRDNDIGHEGAKLLAENNTLERLWLHSGNPKLSIASLNPFLNNKRLIYFPLVGGGGGVKMIRDHIKANVIKPEPYIVHPVKGLTKPKIVVIKSKAQAPEVKQEKKVDKDQEVLDETATPKKFESGEIEFQTLLAAVSLDVKDFNSDIDYLIWYMAIALNLYMHNASFAPVQGYGAVQETETESPLFYNRSQLGHPHQSRYEFFVKTPEDGKKRAYLPCNQAYRSILKSIVPEEYDEETKKGKKVKKKKITLETTLKQFDERMIIKEGSIPTHFGTFLGSSGVRRNNLAIYVDGMEYLVRKKKREIVEKTMKEYGSKLHAKVIRELEVKSSQELAVSLQAKIKEDLKQQSAQKKLIERCNDMDIKVLQEEIEQATATALKDKFNLFFPKKLPKDIQQLKTEVAEKRAKAILQRFKELQEKHPSVKGDCHFQQDIHQQRQYHLDQIKKKFGKKDDDCFELKLVGSNCLHINIDAAKLGLTEKKDDDNKRRLTKTFLAFFCGLLNYRLKKNNRSIHIDLRQSFGFFRPTLTGVGVLKLRLSLGLEPDCFDDVLVEALDQFNAFLKTHKNYPEAPLIMKTEKQIEDGPAEAQYYLESHKEVEEAFNAFVNNFASSKKKQIKSSSPGFPSVHRKKTVMEKNMDATALFPLLERTVQYAFNKVKETEAFIANEKSFGQLKHAYWHSLNKLYQYCHETVTFLEKIDDYGVTYAYMLANNLLERILEYLVSLDSLIKINQSMLGLPDESVKLLNKTEKEYTVRTFELPGECVTTYFMDSGQQAIAASVLAMDMQLYPEGKYDHKLFTYEESYFEFEEFLKKVGGIKIDGRKNDIDQKKIAKIGFVDVTRIEHVDFKDLPALKALIIDLSKNPNLDNLALKEKIGEAREKGCWVILASSCLKHEELGLDKYQAGKVITIAPSEKQDQEAGTLHNELKAISDEAMRSSGVASYLQMVNEICGDKLAPKKTRSDLPVEPPIFCSAVINNVGLFKKSAEHKEGDGLSKKRLLPKPRC